MEANEAMHRILPAFLVCLTAICGCDMTSGDDAGNDKNDDLNNPPQRLSKVETDLLALINTERGAHDPARPPLARDTGMDLIIGWHVGQMAGEHFLNHKDANGRESEARARYYGENKGARCSEIIQFWGGTPSGQVHYEGYFNSPPHHAGYLEEAPYNLGPTRWAGVAAFEGTGPAETSFSGRSGSYTGVMLCDGPITIVIDPYDE